MTRPDRTGGGLHREEPVDHISTVRDEPRVDEPTPSGQVIVGIDGSDASAAALAWAVDHARSVGAAVEAVAVWHEPVQFGAPAASPTPRQAFADEAKAWLTSSLPRLAHDEPGAELRTRTVEGDPATVLTERAHDARLLVLGNHGRGAWGSAILGSVAQRCAQRATCPVVLVPARHAE